MAAMGPADRAGAVPDGKVGCPSGLQACFSKQQKSSRPERQNNTMHTHNFIQEKKTFLESQHLNSKASVHPSQREADQGWSNMTAMHLCNVSETGEAPYRFCSPESVEMDEIMAAMVLTSLSCNPVVQTPLQTDPGPAISSSADMECGGGELSDSGSSGYWSWDHGNVSPAPSPSVTEMDRSPDESLHIELEQGEELNAKKPKSSFRGVYKCLWPSCGKVLMSSVGMKKHIRMLHLGSGSDQSQREEDFYYTKISCETVDVNSAPAPSHQATGQASFSHLCWASCGSPLGSGHQTPPAPRPRSNSSSEVGSSRPSPLSQSAPSSFWQIHSEHLYQACSPVQISVAPRDPSCQGWNPSLSVSSSAPMVKPRCRSVSVGEQWLQQNSATNRLQTISVSPSRSHCSFKKARGESKKCRKVYGVERKDQWCTACRWKKACQRFPD
ncbi:hypothetical protein LDENG_00180490 [Lucifuga dentata]|nr:hypothetical protein LDENG_00180490 [Lucifuga dentata]